MTTKDAIEKWQLRALEAQRFVDQSTRSGSFTGAIVKNAEGTMILEFLADLQMISDCEARNRGPG